MTGECSGFVWTKTKPTQRLQVIAILQGVADENIIVIVTADPAKTVKGEVLAAHYPKDIAKCLPVSEAREASISQEKLERCINKLLSVTGPSTVDCTMAPAFGLQKRPRGVKRTLPGPSDQAKLTEDGEEQEEEEEDEDDATPVKPKKPAKKKVTPGGTGGIIYYCTLKLANNKACKFSCATKTGLNNHKKAKGKHAAVKPKKPAKIQKVGTKGAHTQTDGL
jgi:hypothetical protein